MKKRTRLMQRNVRTVLILVDGKSTVADLISKTGNPQLTEYALGELVNGGYIEPRASLDSGDAKSAHASEEIIAAQAVERHETTMPAQALVSEPVVVAVPIETLPVPDETANAAMREDSPASNPGDELHRPVDASTDEALIFPDDAPDESTYPADTPTAIKDDFQPALVERIKELMSGRDRQEEALPAEPKSFRQTQTTSWLKILVGALVGALAIAFLGVIFFPYDRYLPEVERAFSQVSERPVKVGSMHVDFFPRPGLLLDSVRMGTGENEIRIAEVRLQPVVGTLFSSKIFFRQAVLTGVALPLERIVDLPGVFKAMARPTARAGVEQLSMAKADLSFGGLGLADLEGEARLSDNGSLQSLSMRTSDRSLSIEVKPKANGLGIVLDGLGWRPYQGSPYFFDSVNLTGSYQDGQFTIASMELHIFDGVVSGVGVLRADKRPSVVGEISFERINASRFGTALGIGQQFTGDTSGTLRYFATADSWRSIFSRIEGSGELMMRRGSVRGVDLVEAVRRVSKTSVQGGSTSFETLAGKMKLTPESYQFTGLVLSSGLMKSTGYFEVSKDLSVRSRIELQMQGSVNQTRVPISISGPLQSPIVKVGKS